MLGYVLGNPRYIRNGGALVRVDDDVLKCVVFLGGEKGDDIHLQGTGFLLKDGGGTESTTYLVTAGHAAEGIGEPFGIRFNTKKGDFKAHPMERAEWVYHPEYPYVDVAAMVFEPPVWADTTRYHVRNFATDFKMDTKNFGPGDFTYVVGLYRLMRETRRNIPLVHTGHIAALAADQPLPVHNEVKGKTYPTRGYLIESRAIQGASGSPVFVRRSVKHEIPNSKEPEYHLGLKSPGSMWLLGLWQASWPLKPGEDLIEGAGVPEGSKVGVGIGIVVPAPFIQDVLDMPQIKEQREQAKRAVKEATAMTTDTAPPTTDENPQHREDFSRLLDAAVPVNKSDR